MRALTWGLLALLLATYPTKAQEKEITVNYQLLLTLVNPDLGFVNKPSALTVTPDKKYLVCSLSSKKSTYQIYEISTGRLIHTIVSKGKYALFQHHFESDQTLYLRDRKKVMKINVSTGTYQILDFKSLSMDLRENLSENINLPAWTWEGGNLSEMSYPGQYIIRYTPYKLYMYYNMNRLND